LAQIAKTNAIAGTAAGVAVGVIDSIISVRQSPPRDRYDVLVQGLTSVGTGAVLGALAATVTALAGVSVAAIAGRGALAIAVPMVATTVATDSAHKPVERLVRSWSEDVVKGLKRTLAREASPNTT
jgi:cobalamin biosynthesis protein CobD/CbiB